MAKKQKINKSINKGGSKKDLPFSYNDCVVEVKYTDKKSIKITKNFLDSIFEKAIVLQKDPYIVLAIKKDEKNDYVIKCKILIEKRTNNNG